jgi:hypothetical protein
MALAGAELSAGKVLAVSSGAAFPPLAIAPRSGGVLIFTSVPFAGAALRKSGGPSDCCSGDGDRSPGADADSALAAFVPAPAGEAIVADDVPALASGEFEPPGGAELAGGFTAFERTLSNVGFPAALSTGAAPEATGEYAAEFAGRLFRSGGSS